MDHITMNRKEREQLIIFEKLKKGEIRQIEAALRLRVTPRWVRKKFKRYVDYGDIGLVHGNRNRISSRRWDGQESALALELLQSEWQGFGPTFTAEKLKELKGINISKETLRKKMIIDGVWQAKKRKLKHRKRRERKLMVGIMTQLDGSPHDWFEGRAPWATLLVFIDDATSRILWLEFVESESCIGVMKATKNYMIQHGIPHMFYVDFGSVFSVNTNNLDRDKKTQWERVVESFSTKVQHAYSPQAKGRVERANGTLQDRLVKELRLASVSSIDAANQFLRGSDFIAKHNKRFAVTPAQQGDAHKFANLNELDNAFCFQENRVLTNDYTILFRKRIFQLGSQQRTIIRPRDAITISTYLDHSIKLSVRKIDLVFIEIFNRPQKPLLQPKIREYKPCKPSKNSRRWSSGLMPTSAPKSLFRRVG
jgi:hypothetical protein